MKEEIGAMRIPHVRVKFRRRAGIPYAIEEFAGKQYRCRHCNVVFDEERRLTAHLTSVARTRNISRRRPSVQAPVLNQSFQFLLPYQYDVVDFLKRKWLRLKPNETYDGILPSSAGTKKGPQT